MLIECIAITAFAIGLLLWGVIVLVGLSALVYVVVAPVFMALVALIGLLTRRFA